MNFEAIQQFLNDLTFRQAVWLFPPVFALHVFEEAPQFTAWANRHASSRFTQADLIRNNALGMGLVLVLCFAVAFFPHPVVIFLFFSLGLWQAGFNTFFHVGTTAAFGVYSPGLISSVTLYPALFYYLSRLAFHENLLTGGNAIFALLFGALIHAYVVAVQVFFFDPLRMTRPAKRL